MKKILSILFFVLLSLAAQAQLEPPKAVATDTLYVVDCMYNGVILSEEDWPCRMFFESSSNIEIAGQTYVKKNPTKVENSLYDESWNGHISFYHYKKAMVNGRRVKLLHVVKTGNDCDMYPIMKYMIDDYTFYVVHSSLLELFFARQEQRANMNSKSNFKPMNGAPVHP